jgi:molybdate transport system substrate-binding protein
MSELVDVPGTTLVGPLPAEINLVSEVVVAVAVRTEAPEAARALVSFLRSPKAAAVLKASGMEPQ